MATNPWTSGITVTSGVVIAWLLGFYAAPVEANMGQVYRIIFLHVPAAAASFLASFVLLVFSIWALNAKNERPMYWSKATAEVGCLFTILTLWTGAVWGRPTWGVWWTWDARLTTTLILGILYIGYLMLYRAMAPGRGRQRACAVLGILIFADVPIIYKSVAWWRTLHQPSDIIDNRGANMDPTMLNILLINLAAMVLFSAWLILVRGKNVALREEIETTSLEQLKS